MISVNFKPKKITFENTFIIMNLNKSFIIFWFIFSMCLISAIIALPTLSKEEIFKNFLKKKLSKEEMEKLLRILSATTGTFRPSHHNY